MSESAARILQENRAFQKKCRDLVQAANSLAALDPFFCREEFMEQSGIHLEAARIAAVTTRLFPKFALGYAHLGCALSRAWLLDEAEMNFKIALSLNSHAAVHDSLAYVLRTSAKHAEALAHHNAAISLEPSNADFHINRSCTLFEIGEWPAAWKDWEYRRSGHHSWPLRTFKEPVWTGSQDISGKTILVHPEMCGHGDIFKLVRLLPCLHGAKVLLEVNPGLAPVLSSLQEPVAIFDSQRRVMIDYHLPLMSLPSVIALTPQRVPPPPYISRVSLPLSVGSTPLPDRKRGRPRIGIVWSSIINQHLRRNCPLKELFPLLALSHLDFFVCQKKVSTTDQTILKAFPNVARPQLNTWMDTASVLSQMDLVISIDSAPLHLAGALGVPLWAIIGQYVNGWVRWPKNNQTDPWYPHARIFRGSWPNVVSNLFSSLSSFP